MNSGWTDKISHNTTKQLGKLNTQTASCILDYLRRLETEFDLPRVAKPLKGSLSILPRFRVGDYRMICKLYKESFTIVDLRVVYRKKAYRE